MAITEVKGDARIRHLLSVRTSVTQTLQFHSEAYNSLAAN